MKSNRALFTVAGFATLCASGLTYAQTQTFNTGQAARMVVGQVNFTAGNYGATNTLLGAPSAIAVANGVLWVADANRLGALPSNNRVLRFSDITTYPTATADPSLPDSVCPLCRGTASLVLGQPDFVSADVALTGSGMRNPTGIATDGNVLVVADTDHNRILIWKSPPHLNGQPADVVIGQPDMVSQGTSVPPTASSLRGPTGVWLAGGKLYVADTQDNRILIFNKIPATNNAAADVVIGQPSFTSFVQPDLTQNNATPSASNMQTPVSVTTDGQRMYVSDLGQSRVLIWNAIPTTNGAPADIALGQPDMVSALANNSVNTTGDTYDTDNNPIGAIPVLCQSTGTDENTGTPLYPPRCGRTLSLPRYAISDGTHLFIADAGNDRVLVYNSIPTVTGQKADVILGQPDEFSDNTGQNPDGTNAFQSPCYLAWDVANQNLYVSDTYNRRILVFTPEPLNVPLGAARNAASLSISAIGTVLIGGTVTAKDTVTVTIGGTGYTYTVLPTDTLATIAQGLAKLINKAPDPNVTASVDTDTNTLVLTARVSGSTGSSVTLATSLSSNATESANTSSSSLSINTSDPTQLAPGSLVQISGASLCDNTASADLTQPFLPTSLGGCQVFSDGNVLPLLYVSPTQINVQLPLFYVDRTSTSIYVRTTHADGSLTVTAPIASTIVTQSPGIFADPGNDPRAGLIYHYSSGAMDAITVNGVVRAGDTGTITIGSNSYTYTVNALDTLQTVADAFVNMINLAPDPNVTASTANVNTNIVLQALPGTYQNTLSVTTSETAAPSAVAAAGSGVTVNSDLLLTPTNPTMCCNTNANDLVVVGGAINAGDVATITVGPNTYNYTVQSSDTLASVASALVNLINAGPDPNVNASLQNGNVWLLSYAFGTGGEGVPVSANVSGTSAQLTLSTEFPSTCCSIQLNARVTLKEPAQPGEFVYLYATGIGDTTPEDQQTGQIFQGGSANPPTVPVDTFLTGSYAGSIINTQLVPGTVGVYSVLLQISSSATTDALAETSIAQQGFNSNVVTMPIQAPGSPFTAAELAGHARKAATARQK